MANNVELATSSYIAQKVAANINVQDLTPQSKLSVLINGLVNEDIIFKTYTEDSLKDFYIQTASDAALGRIGAADGIVRTKAPIIRLRAEDEVVSIKQTASYTSTGVMNKGVQLELVSDAYWLVINEDVDLSQAISNKLYISCDVNAKPSENNLNFVEGASYPINIDGNEYSITFERDVAVPVMEETLTNYRERVLYARTTPQTGCQGAIRLAVASNELIDDFSIDFTQNPYNIVIFNTTLFDDDSDLETLTSYSIPTLDTRLYAIKSEGSSYNISVAKKINLTLELKAIVANPRSVSIFWETFYDYIKSLYKVGSILNINKDLLTTYLVSQEESIDFLSDYSFNIYKNFLGREYASTSKSIQILNDEYPYIEAVRIV